MNALIQTQTQQQPNPRLTIPERLQLSVDGKPFFLTFYEFAKHILGNEKLGMEHKLWQNRLFDAVNVQGLHKLLLLKPRGTYKTTFYTIALPLWLHLDNPNLRILICNSIDENAKKFLSEITGHYLKNEKLTQLYQQLNQTIPVDPNKALMSSLRLTNCTKIQKEPNISCIGYGSSIVSQHFDVIIVDDLCDRNDRESVTVREDKKKWFSDLASLLEPNGLLLMVGTRWSADDVYGYIINDLNPKHAPQDKYHIEVESCYTFLQDGTKPATFPRILNLEKLEELKIDKTPDEFLANYENSPISSEFALFKLDKMSFYDPQEFISLKNLIYYGFCDPSLGKKDTSDYSAFITIAVDSNGIIYVVDAIIERLIPSALKERIFQQAQRYRYSRIGIESNGFQELFIQQLQIESTRNHLYASIEGINNSRNKKGRIESLEPLIRGDPIRPGIVRFRRDWNTAYPLLIDQMIQFLAGSHDDGIDALEGAVSMIRSGYSGIGGIFFSGR